MKKPRCGAKTRRGTPCQAAAIWSTRSQRYTRCGNHGGLSTGRKRHKGSNASAGQLRSMADTRSGPKLNGRNTGNSCGIAGRYSRVCHATGRLDDSERKSP
jgi:hypothetical protein